MKLEYLNPKDESTFILTDFSCAPSRELLKNNGLYKIIWCTHQTPLNVFIDGYRIDLQQDQLVFCTPINLLEIDKHNTGLTAFVFNREFYCIRDHDEEVSCNGFLFFGSSHPPVITLTREQKDSFLAMLLLFKEEFSIKDHIQGEMLRTLLKRMLITSRRMLKDQLPEPNLPNTQLDLIRKFNLLVEQNFKSKHQVSEYADLMHKSPKTLSNLFIKYGANSPLQVINERILLEAKRLLLFSEMTSEQIAYELGYKDASHFSRFFKKNQGISPIEFKKERQLVK